MAIICGRLTTLSANEAVVGEPQTKSSGGNTAVALRRQAFLLQYLSCATATRFSVAASLLSYSTLTHQP
jgi:hypothetical protein